MNRRVRAAAVLMAALVLLASLGLAAYFTQMQPEAPVTARARPAPGALGASAANASPEGALHTVTCLVRTVESPRPPGGATCRYVFVPTEWQSGFDAVFEVTSANGTPVALPSGLDGALTAAAPGYRPQTQRILVERDEAVTFYLRLEPGLSPTTWSSTSTQAPPAPPPPPPRLGEGGGGSGSEPPQGEPRPSGGRSKGAPPPGPPRPACSDGLDNDGDGRVDFPQDVGCEDGNDADEWNETLAAPAWRFGRPGRPIWDQSTSSMDAPEPTIGLSWAGASANAPKVLMQFGSATYRIGWGTYAPGPYNPTGHFPTDASGNETAPPSPSWANTNNPHGPVQNLDPLLWTERTTGRTLAGGLAGWNSQFGVTDNEGLSWGPAPVFAYSGAAFDHQGVGSGPYAGTPPPGATYPASGQKLAFYYCAQTPPGVMACTRSDDGGTTWSPTSNQAFGGCGGLHGHPLVSRVDGSVYVPARNCGGANGMAMSTDNGVTWDLRTVPGSALNGGFDPDVGISIPNPSISPPSTGNWLYYAMGDNSGAHVALSKRADRLDLGAVPLGGGNGVNGGAGDGWLDLGRLVPGCPLPPAAPTTDCVVRAVMPDVQVGDDRRAAVSFLGSTQAFDHDSCVAAQKWDYYVAITYDGGYTWNVTKASPDPVQSGGVWSQGGSNPCRNLLDFNDMQMDAHGRLYVGFGDGCIPPGCTANTSGQGTTNTGAILRQRTGCGLFRAFDEPGVDADCVTPRP